MKKVLCVFVLLYGEDYFVKDNLAYQIVLFDAGCCHLINTNVFECRNNLIILWFESEFSNSVRFETIKSMLECLVRILLKIESDEQLHEQKMRNQREKDEEKSEIRKEMQLPTFATSS